MTAKERARPASVAVAGSIPAVSTVSVGQDRLRVQAFWACASGPGASSRTGPASTGLLSPCERPVPVLRREPQRVAG